MRPFGDALTAARDQGVAAGRSRPPRRKDEEIEMRITRRIEVLLRLEYGAKRPQLRLITN